MAIDMGVKGILFIAHIGKFVKVAAGIMNTHSHSADARMEVLASNAIRAGAPLECAKEILNASTTDEALDILNRYQMTQGTMKEVLDRIQFYLNHRSIMVAFSLYFGFTSEGVDNAAHVGGLICGFIMAVLLYHPLRSYHRDTSGV